MVEVLKIWDFYFGKSSFYGIEWWNRNYCIEGFTIRFAFCLQAWFIRNLVIWSWKFKKFFYLENGVIGESGRKVHRPRYQRKPVETVEKHGRWPGKIPMWLRSRWKKKSHANSALNARIYHGWVEALHDSSQCRASDSEYIDRGMSRR